MFSLLKLITIFSMILVIIKPIFCQQSYDNSHCTAQSQSPESNYPCSSSSSEDSVCDTYLVYRAQHSFNTLSSISSLFNLSQSALLLPLNNLTENDSSTSLVSGREIIIPLPCTCIGSYYKAVLGYSFVSGTTSFADIACSVFEGLVKVQGLVEENPNLKADPSGSFTIDVPIRCACPTTNQIGNGVKYLVTYPVIEKDQTDVIAAKFGIPQSSVLDANKLGQNHVIFPETTLLIPTNDVPSVNYQIGPARDNARSPRYDFPIGKDVPDEGSSKWRTGLAIGASVCSAVVLMIAAFMGFARFLLRNHPTSFQPLSGPKSLESSDNVPVPPDFLDGVSKLKHSLKSYSLEELRTATGGFSEGSRIGAGMYQGRIAGFDVAIEQMDSEEAARMYQGRIAGFDVAIEQMDSEEAARRVVYILTKINHLNIVRLEGSCLASNPYLVSEFADNGSLRDCLSGAKLGRELTWARRKQIAYDVAEALHYLHHYTTPPFVHLNINSRNVLITVSWRAKISGFKMAKPVIYSQEKTPQDVAIGQASLKVDVFAFGVLLLELLSAKDFTKEKNFSTDSVNFFAVFELESLKEFLDPVLEERYPLGDAVCLALLAKACMDQDPNRRPTMSEVLITLLSIV